MKYLKTIVIFVVILSSCIGSNSEKVYIVSDKCNKCNGEGKAVIKCDHCNGSGTQWSNYDAGNGVRTDCVNCVDPFCGHNTDSHELEGISFSEDWPYHCARYGKKGAVVGEVFGDCNACEGKGVN